MELAIVLPVLMLIFFGTIDALGMMFTKQSMSLAAYEATRVAVREDATTKEVIASCQELLAQRGVKNAVVQTVPKEIATVDAGELVEIQVQYCFGDEDMFLATLNAGREANVSFAAMKQGTKSRPLGGTYHDKLQTSSSVR